MIRAEMEGLHVPEYCPRGRRDCRSLSQIISGGHASFICCGKNDGTTRTEQQDEYRLCFKNSTTDEMSDNDARDLLHLAGVINGALSVVSEDWG